MTTAEEGEDRDPDFLTLPLQTFTALWGVHGPRSLYRGPGSLLCREGERPGKEGQV